MRHARELAVVVAVVALGGLVRALRATDDALLGAEPLVLALTEVASVALLALLVSLVFGRRRRPPDAVGVASAYLVLAALGAGARQWLPEGRGAIVVALAALFLGRRLVRRWPALRWALAAIAVVPAWVALPSGRDALPRAKGGAGDQRIVLLTLDTFRADHLGAIGGSWFDVRTPHLDRLAGQGLLFTQGVSPAPLTLPSHAAMLTGQLPDAIGTVQNGRPLRGDVSTVAAELSAAGWTTGAFVSAAVLDRHSGIDRGFAHFDDLFADHPLWAQGSIARGLVGMGILNAPAQQRRGDRTVARALRWLDHQAGPVFLWVHLYDPHSPYAPPEHWASAYDPAQPGLPGSPEQLAPMRRRQRTERAMLFDTTPRDLRPSLAAYAGEISWTDEVAGRLLAALRPDDAVVVAADHGESLVEHGYFLNHGRHVYQPSVRVPIIVVAPGHGVAGARDDHPTPLTAIAPTLRALAGLPAAGSLLDRHAAPPDDEELRSYGVLQQARTMLVLKRRQQVAWRRGDSKWIVDQHGVAEHYDLARDPAELHDDAAQHPDRDTWAARGVAEIERINELRGHGRASREQADALRALGYVDD
ncbi:MAG: hypothetical protein D6798_15865 [Deltaproteobacteria bacterium]|nr:MAG: hypothetical protein D6798_15865 [Deltaproteobacteria bacterium]